MIRNFSLKYCVWLIVAVMFMSIAGCKTKKETVQPRVISTKETRKAFRTLGMKKTEFTIETSSNKSSLNGTMRIARDSMIFCTIMPFPGMEFARLLLQLPLDHRGHHSRQRNLHRLLRFPQVLGNHQALAR